MSELRRSSTRSGQGWGPPRRSSGQRLRSLLSPRSVAGQVFLLQLGVILLLVIATVVALVLQARHESTQAARDRVLSTGEAFANAPDTAAALDGPDPTAVLQPRAEAARKRSGVDNIVVSTPEGIRITHREPELIGEHVVGHYKEAARGEVLTEIDEGPLGLTVYATVPVFRPDGSVAGIVLPEITVENVNEAVGQQLPVIFAAAAGALLLAATGAALVSGRLRRQTRGLGPTEITRMYEHHDAVLHSVREGVLIVGGDGRLLLANDEARRLLDLPEDAEGRELADLGLTPGIGQSLSAGRAASDEVHLSGDRLLAVNVRPVDPHGSPSGNPSGSVATLRDTTELQVLTGRAEVARERLQLLYDAGVRVGTTLDVVRTAEEVAQVAVGRFADVVTVELLDPVLRGEEPEQGAFLEMRRTALVGLEGEHPLYPVGELIHFVPSAPAAVGILQGHAVLARDLVADQDWQAQDPERVREVLEQGFHSLISAPLAARGRNLGNTTFWRRGASPPFDEDDTSFAEELAARAAVAVDNARRYTREHTLAVTLQRSLLPRALPEQSALHVAHRYLPAQGGVGGDWFDVIPLPGARVALVVGDVVGHGLHAAATMGRLRTAVHNFSSLDLPPDELLAHLDELVAGIDTEEVTESDAPDVTGATCLYAVYDPVDGVCTVARAGHLGPALVHPDGSVAFPDVPVSPPLGLGGGMPVETATLRLPADSRLVLFTDGLIERRDRDIDVGLALLHDALAGHPDRDPEKTCTAVVDALRPDHPLDDIALLVARTRLLDPDQVAVWDVPDDPAAVPRIRGEVARRLADWELDEIAFTTELIVSELVTNAIRYGIQPARLRLLYDANSLICEVADASSTSPHLRRAATTDEGGRGLFLVAQCGTRWGTRYTARGKVIWAEQSLHDTAAEPETSAADLLDQWADDEL
ncbi:SpoIIE family protein phosphatase/ATP-binding protein [Streptomyces cavernicola]|uniref:SpoIIE family protein phosphatase n=1 Tax=Streptomyces cavernicola TaxID=3043613 RepID=A0ABT6SEA8_9ACTN|nr:SpoIIE family protein phosphatase/ATP-binding protein [Streptomyces sp. B-S-A6]MDI3406513.1 SpoIIE family protein phosphatase [Streptomyces sp. B-S-A6]